MLKNNHDYTKVTPQKFDKILQSIQQKSQNIDTLNLSQYAFTKEQMKKLCMTLTKNTGIKYINFSSCNIDAQQAAYIAEMLQENKTIIEINLAYNNIGDTGITYFANVVRYNQNLKQVTLLENRIGDCGAKCLANSLTKDCKLYNINLSNNHISDEGKAILESALKINYLNPNLIDTSNNIISLDIIHDKISTKDQKLLRLLQKSQLPSPTQTTITIDCQQTEEREQSFYQLLFEILISKTFITDIIIENLDNTNPLFEQIILYLTKLLEKNSTINSIQFSHCFLRTDEAAKSFSTLFTSQNFIHNVTLTASDILANGSQHVSTALGNNRSITELVLDGITISGKSNHVPFVATIIKTTKSITNLHLREMDFETHPYQDILTALHNHPSITSLTISDVPLVKAVLEDTQITTKELIPFTYDLFISDADATREAIKNKIYMQSFHAYLNPRSSIVEMIVCVTKNPTISNFTISLPSNTKKSGVYYPIVCKDIEDGWCNKSAITHFKLTGCELNSDSFQYLSTFIRDNKTLQILDLIYCPFDKGAAIELVNCITQNQPLHLSSIYLGTNYTTKAAQNYIKKHAPKNPSIFFCSSQTVKNGMITYTNIKQSSNKAYYDILFPLVQLRVPKGKLPPPQEQPQQTNNNEHNVQVPSEIVARITSYFPLSVNDNTLFHDAKKISDTIFAYNKKHLKTFAANIEIILSQIKIYLTTQQKRYSNEVKEKIAPHDSIISLLQAIQNTLESAQKNSAELLKDGCFKTNTIIKDTITSLKLPISTLAESIKKIETNKNIWRIRKDSASKKLEILTNNLKTLTTTPNERLAQQKTILQKIGIGIS
jgi:hypothetical protein